jgi:hypothetical protein
MVLLARGRVDESLDVSGRARELLERLGSIEEGDATVRLARAEALRAAGREDDARAAIAAARANILGRGARIADETFRAGFLALPDHARALALAEAWGAGEP